MIDKKDASETMNQVEECMITDVDRDREMVYVNFGKFGDAGLAPVDNKSIVEATIHTDSLEPDGIVRIDELERKWSLRDLDEYFWSRRGEPIQQLANEDEPFSQIGRWFIFHFDFPEK
jgi:hypothetical protein